MDERTATLILTKKLRSSGYVNVIMDPVVKSYLIDNAKSIVLDLHPGKLNVTPYEKKELEREFPESNYHFISHVEEARTYGYDFGSYILKNALVMPIALIGSIEEKVLEEKFYKDVPEDIAEAFGVLNISNFIRYYEIYSSHSRSDFPGLCYNLRNHTKPSDEKRILEFFEFVFTLPYEDRNKEVNREILNETSNIDFCKILIKEYSEGEQFKDYFSVLESWKQRKVIEKIKELPKQDKFLNSWLFQQGFTFELDYIELYKEDAQNFIAYFNRSSPELKELIVSDLLNCEFTNPEVIKFLEEKHSNLLRDTNFKDESSSSHPEDKN